ncbi:penicillin-binding protein [Williamsia sterculiae]|uniref:penicillin-binding protein n=1 Tax=Williamsia sterculiae TaxID=1344003 RepID=UPI000970A67B|nr:transglycosylase domain-containing protein [Williamsia sterculiae]
MSDQTGSRSKALWAIAGCCLLAGVLVAGLLFPVASGVGYVSNKAASTVENVSSELVNGTVPEVSTVTDVNGAPIAYLYDQRREQVGYNDIAPDMIRAIISIEDRRFLEHDGVDWKGTIRAALKNSSSGEVQQGASTLDQQYIKNYQLLVLARTEADRAAAIETTPARKLREVRMALSLEQSLTEQAERDKNLSPAAAKQEAKKEIVTRYLNLVPFGNGAYGIEAAAQTYFGKPAKALDAVQAAMLAGMVQSSSALDPYTNPKGVTDRRNLVLDTMVQNFPQRADEFRADKAKPLGVLRAPRTLPQGCISAKDAGYFCDYALQFMAENGISRDTVLRGGYTIRTTLDPRVQSSVLRASQRIASPDLDGVADVMSVLRPWTPQRQSHDLVAMVSSRNYGLNQQQYQTVQPQPYSMVGDGAGSIFKIFTVAASMEKGLGTATTLSVPQYFSARGMGDSNGANGCPANYYCVKNAGTYPAALSLTQALATSPNTPFVQMLQTVGVKPAVDMAVRLGLRSYGQPGTSGQGDMSLADYIKKGNFGSFTLGPFAVNGLELSNVAATLSSHGMWCPPNPIASITQPKRDRYGNQVIGPDGKPATVPVPFEPPKCEQVVEPGLADTLANALSQDDRGGGTSAGAAGGAGWSLPLSGKTGTTEAHRSSAFLGFTNEFAGSSYIYGDSPTPSDICTSPLRQCYSGDLYGGNEPAQIWYQAMQPIATMYGPIHLPEPDQKYVNGSNNGQVPDVTGQTASRATATLQEAGFKVNQLTTDSGAQQGTVAFTSPSDTAIPGSTITIYVSTGRSATPAPQPGNSNGGGGPAPAVGPPTTLQIPGLGPIVIGGNNGG